jgi:hypothetical protein
MREQLLPPWKGTYRNLFRSGALLDLLVFFDPANDLVLIEDQPTTSPAPEVRQPSRNESLPHSPGRTTDQPGYLADTQRWPQVAHRWTWRKSRLARD